MEIHLSCEAFWLLFIILEDYEGGEFLDLEPALEELVVIAHHSE